jgi:hypothetical protein
LLTAYDPPYNNNATARELRSVEEIISAQIDDELEIKDKYSNK